MHFLGRTFRSANFLAQISGLGVFLCLLSSCSPFYLLQVAIEEGKILWRRQPIEQLLQDEKIKAETAEKLRLVLAVREYARDKLNFNVGGSYATYSYVDGRAPAHVLMATPKTELKPYTWWYLFVGRVPYKGFPSEESANAEAGRFAAQGYDTYIRQAAAFSTLGWFDDPLLAHLLDYDKVTLAEVIFHELLHNTFFLKGAVDFNESLANFVGYRAAVLFFRDRYGANSKEYLRAVQVWDQELEFAKFLAEVVLSLNHLYASAVDREEKLRLREEIFARSQKEWALRTVTGPGHRHAGFSRETLNNAVISHYLLYSSQLDVFESLYEASGRDLRRFVESIVQGVGNSEDPFTAVRNLLVREASRTAGSRATLR